MEARCELVRIGLGILLLSLLSAACGKTFADGPGGGQHPSAAGSGGSLIASAEGGTSSGQAGAGHVPGSGGAANEASYVALTGAPIFTRVHRLTNRQWENAVTDILRFKQRHDLASTFAAQPLGYTAFDNNELVLFVDGQRFTDFESGAEAAAAIATGSAEALAALYPGDDAAGFVRALGRRAFRRPLTAEEETKYQNIFAKGESLYGAGFANGASLVIRALLESPHFLYRTELGEAGAPLTAYELASKLSFWLLDTTPSDSLLDAAAAGKLAETEQIVATARGMLEDPRATAVMRDFHGQLVHVANFDSLSTNNTPEYDPSITPDLALTANAFFDLIFVQNLGLREFLTSKQAYVTPGLAPFYGLDAPKKGLELRDMGPARSGFFMQVPYLMLGGIGLGTNPIMRGLRLERAMLCGPQQPPPTDVVIPPVPEPVMGQTTRERVVQLNGACGSSCHRYIDPLGFALENFDGLGRTRATDGGRAIDTSGTYPFVDGVHAFADGNELMTIMANNAQVQTCYAKQLTSYAFGRDLVESDRRLLDSLAKVSGSHSLKELIIALVKNPAFRNRKDDSSP